MSTYQEYFKDKKVTVMGLGLLGRGVGDAAYIADAGASEVIVTDLKSETELTESMQRLQQYDNIKFILGEHREEDFIDRDLILVAAGVPMDSPYLITAQKAGVLLAQSAALFAQVAQIPVIGVTGTRGKSTVTHMIHHVLTHLTGEPVILGGNIRGVSNLQLLHQVHEDAVAVMELDSWQLQGWGWAELSPQVAVFTNFMEDHLNYYTKVGMDKDAAMTAYFADKANIFRYQEDSGVLVTTPAVFTQAQAYARATAITIGQGVVLADTSVLPDDLLLATPGEHNRLNAALAYEALRAIGLSEEEICDGLATFPGVPGRLEYLGALGEHTLRVYNDNNATTPAATIAGIRAVAQGKNVVLIVGGADKKIELTDLVTEMVASCTHVVVIPGTGSDRLVERLNQLGAHDLSWQQVDSLAAAVDAACAAGRVDDVLLFSPGFASFGMFANEYERNDQFVAVVRAAFDQMDTV